MRHPLLGCAVCPQGVAAAPKRAFTLFYPPGAAPDGSGECVVLHNLWGGAGGGFKAQAHRVNAVPQVGGGAVPFTFKHVAQM